MKLNTIIQGDCLEVLKTIPDESIDCIITSPPYYGLRDYGQDAQIGLEKTLDEYLNKLLKITAECKRVLKKTGTLWWNHGDSYVSRGKLGGDIDMDVGMDINRGCGRIENYPEKSLLMTPYRLALRMIDEQQWILRNQIIWFKPNCMPSSVKDRFTVDYEPVFFFVKSKKYYFKQLLEELANPARKNFQSGKRTFGVNKDRNDNDMGERSKNFDFSQGRNKRCVWRVTTKPFKEAHFATFPEDLVRPMIEAGCPEGGIVLDPFIGSGTTAVVAKKQNKNYIGIELNHKYIKIAEDRIKNIPTPLL